MAEEKRKRGRPPKPEAARRRRMIGLRLRDQVRDLLEREASAAGRSLSAEIEHRIETGLEHRHLLQDALESAYGADLSAVVVALAEAARSARVGTNAISYAFGATKDRDLTDSWLFAEVRTAIDTVLEKLEPDGTPEIPAEWAEKNVSTGRQAAITALNQVLGHHPQHLGWVKDALVAHIRRGQKQEEAEPQADAA